MIHTDWERQRELLSAHLDGELTPREDVALRAHLAACGECQRELAALRRTRALLHALPTPALPRSFTLPADHTSGTVIRRAVPAWTRPVQALGGIAAMIGLGLLITTTIPHPGQGAAAGVAAPSYAQHTVSGATSTAPSLPAPTQRAGADSAVKITPAPTSTATATAQPTIGEPVHTQPPTLAPAQPFPVAPVSGGALLVGGAAALTVSSLARRRRRH